MNDSRDQRLPPGQYYDPAFACEAAKILPGEYFATRRDMLIVTVLGSCVSACLHDSHQGIGGMNHFLLPGTPDSLPGSDASARYGVHAMELLLNQMMKLGAQKNRLVAKVFGGGNMLQKDPRGGVGTRNAEFVLSFLATENIPVVGQDLLADFPRKVYFFSTTGRVLIKRLRRINNDTLLQRERDYIERLQHSRISGDVDLF